MKIFLQTKRVFLSKDKIAKAADFSKAVISTINYSDSNQTIKSKIQNDHFISKLGEEAVKLVFEDSEQIVKGPDYKIYQGRKKSWEEDLFVDGIGVAVKTQKWSAAEKYGLSWTFQDAPVRRDPILKNDENWVCFVLVDDRNEGLECRVFPPFQIKDLTFKNPKLKHLIGKKKVVYFEDLKKNLKK